MHTGDGQKSQPVSHKERREHILGDLQLRIH